MRADGFGGQAGVFEGGDKTGVRWKGYIDGLIVNSQCHCSIQMLTVYLTLIRLAALSTDPLANFRLRELCGNFESVKVSNALETLEHVIGHNSVRRSHIGKLRG
jgi:hypothetical protein